jgi:hypothetical protein
VIRLVVVRLRARYGFDLLHLEVVRIEDAGWVFETVADPDLKDVQIAARNDVALRTSFSAAAANESAPQCQQDESANREGG